jgi:hypothetical protein
MVDSFNFSPFEYSKSKLGIVHLKTRRNYWCIAIYKEINIP